MPRSLLLATLLLATSGCGAKDAGRLSGQLARSCKTTVTYAADGGTHSVYIEGDFNQWSSSADRLTAAGGDGSYKIELELAAGNYGYRLVIDGAPQIDANNPFRQWVGGEEVSRLIVEDCRQPQLELLSATTQWDATRERGALDLEFRFVAGSDAMSPDPSAFSLTVAGTVVERLDFARDRWGFHATIDDLPAGRYAIGASMADVAGRRTNVVDSYRWVEQTAFDWADATIYFAFTDRFRNGDASNDAPLTGVKEQVNYRGGDFAGIRLAIEEGYFEKLGVNVLWLSPVQANPNQPSTGDFGYPTAGYHGYWPSEPRQTQKRFGSLTELKALVEAAHERGIRVIGDLVLNHVHSTHPYYSQHKADDWFNGDGSCVCESCGWEEHKLDCWFTGYLPDLRYDQTAVVDQMVADALWWAQQALFDGYRVDAVKHLRKVAISTLVGRLRQSAELAGETFFLLGETFAGETGHTEISEFIGPSLLDGQFDFPWYWATADAFLRHGRGLSSLDQSVAASEKNYATPSLMANFVGNHDLARAISHANGDISDLWGSEAKAQAWATPPGAPDSQQPYDRLKLAFSFMLTMPGIPTIYYGDEIAMPGAGDPDCRRMMRFDAAVSENEAGVQTHLRKLGQLRKDKAALRSGQRIKLLAEENVYVYARYSKDDVIVVAINRADEGWQGEVYLPSLLALADGVDLADTLSDSKIQVVEGKIKMALNPRASAIFLKNVQP